MIVIVPYRPDWPAQFQEIGSALRSVLGPLALRIDHIGSTSVPNLAAKDRIDIQITVQALESAIEAGLNRLGYNRQVDILQDHIPPGGDEDSLQWIKWIFKPGQGMRPANVHVRIEGRANQRYALLFRDYLRSHPAAAQAYGQVKTALARYHADDVDAYYAIKDPVCDIIVSEAQEWASQTHWTPGVTDC